MTPQQRIHYQEMIRKLADAATPIAREAAIAGCTGTFAVSAHLNGGILNHVKTTTDYIQKPQDILPAEKD